MTELQSINDSDIAIIGMSCRFPCAANIDYFWQNLRDGVESISFFSDEELIASGIESATFKQPNYVKAGTVLSNIELFDAAFFDFSPREAEITDPQHRIFLECAYESLENAGYAIQNGDNVIGVYAGVSRNTYLLNNLYPNRDALTDSYSLRIGNGGDFLPTRVSYKLNLRGPSINVQTACSTSLVAVHLACQSLLNGECDITLAGGVSITLHQKAGYLYQEGMINSPDGHCRAFDAKAKGTVSGNGVSIVVLKRLEQAIADGDHIHAVIKGSAINNDGFLKVGYTAPSVEGQTAVISEAQAIADIDAETISYIEAHGTGTEMGDPIEIAALTKAFRATTEKNGFCAIGSLKTNIGHTDVAAGVAGLIKTVLALKHRLLPPSLHFEQPNPQIDFANSPFYVNRTLSEWKSNGTPRRAGVSSFGIGGTNAHVIVEEAPALEPSRPWQLLVLSAKTPSALDTTAANLAKYLAQHPDINLADVAYTLHCGRQSFKQRRMLVCQGAQKATTALRTLDPKCVFTYFQPIENRPVVFMFSGQGAQYVNMAYELYQTEPTFREEVDKCSDYLKPHLGLELRQILYPSKEQIAEATQQIDQTAITQIVLFVIEYALAKLWMSYGIHPEAMIGHSIGEYVAACLADVFSLEDALSLVAARGQMMQSVPKGAMLAVLLPESEVQPLLHEGLSLAAINNPRRCVVSGFSEAVEALQNQLTQQGVECRRLQTSHAFHSEMMSPILAAFTDRIKQVTLNQPQIPYVSNVTGTWITAAEVTNPNYWATHLRQTVRFAEGLQRVLEDSTQILLEVGPGRTLTTLAKQHPDKVAEHSVLSSLRHPQDNRSDVAFLLNTLGQLWLVGVSVDWSGFYANERRHRLPLPTYPFERQRYWIDPPKKTPEVFKTSEVSQLSIKPESKPEWDNSKKEEASRHSRPNLQNIYVAPRDQLERTLVAIWQKLLGIDQVGIHDDFFDMGGDSLLAISLFAQITYRSGKNSPATTLLQAPTVEQLSNIIREKSKSASWSSLVPIQPSGTKRPFFLVPGGGGGEGEIMVYAKLVYLLGQEQPVYGLLARGLDGEQNQHTQVEAMATDYINEIRAFQPDGPYLLGGECIGGMVAFEMAQQLYAQGQQVGLLVLMDTPYTSGSSYFTYLVYRFFKISQIIYHWKAVSKLEPKERLPYLFEKVKKKMRTLIARFHLNGVPPAAQLQHPTNNYQKTLMRYLPKVYPGHLVLMISEGNYKQNSCLGWETLAAQGSEIYILPGDHISYIREHPQTVANQLKACLDKAQQDVSNVHRP